LHYAMLAAHYMHYLLTLLINYRIFIISTSLSKDIDGTCI